MTTNSENVVDFFNLLPEGCVANAISLTSPRDSCHLSLVASTFRSAAESDAVWERFLPPDYHDIIARAVGQPRLAFARKKDLYLHLCDHPLIIDGGSKSFSLDKMTGKKCYMLAARELSIVWGDTPMYWRWTSFPESRFGEVAELVEVCWLEIRGKISTSLMSQDTTYAAYLVFKSPEGVFGFEYSPAQVCVRICGEEGEARTVYLLGREYPKSRIDGWLEVELGEYVNVDDGEDRDLEISVEEKGGNWKGGLVIEGIEIRPKTVDVGN